MNTTALKKHLLIVDLESTCWKNKQHPDYEMETIEIGALLIDKSKREIIKEFDKFIRPVQNPFLSDFCTELTSIKQDDVKSAKKFPIVFKQFLDWIDDLEKTTFCSWSGYDKWLFQQDCKYHLIEYPFENNHFDIKKLFNSRYKGPTLGLSRALKKLGMKFEGTRHRGIDDARNSWYVFKRLLDAESEQLNLNLD
jgi:inhibitor of KinA sporulation pathway (predicted exonuclease)